MHAAEAWRVFAHGGRTVVRHVCHAEQGRTQVCARSPVFHSLLFNLCFTEVLRVTGKRFIMMQP